MTNYNIAVIAGDGVGPEVIDEGKKALEAIGDPLFTFTDLDWGLFLVFVFLVFVFIFFYFVTSRLCFAANNADR